MGIYSEEILAEIRDRADIVEVISGYISLQKRGDSYIGLCPFHAEKTPSFNINPSKQLFYCFGCGTGGNVFTFIMKKENLTFPEAVKWLADRYSINLPENVRDKGISREFKERRELLKVNHWAMRLFHHSLLNTREGEQALKYLKGRGISDETIKTFMLGYADMSWNSFGNYARSQGIGEDTLYKLGLIIQRKDKRGYYDRFRQRIMFPILDTTKNVIGFGGRAIGDQEPKYLNSPETPVFSKGDNLYALSHIKKDPNLDVIVVEGYMDCIALHQKGFTQAVATLGTAFTQNQAKLLRRYTDGVILAFDADNAGQRATLRSLKILYDEGFSPKVLTMPVGKDPDDFIRLYGADAFKEQLAKAQDHIHFRWNLIKKGLDLTNPNGKIRFLKSAVSVLSGLNRGPELEIYIQDLSEQLQVPVSSIRKEVYRRHFPTNGLRYKKSDNRDNNREISQTQPITGHIKAERTLLKAIIEDQGILENFGDDISPEIFSNKNTREIAEIVINAFHQGREIAVADIFNHLDDEGSAELSKILISKISHRGDVVTQLINHVKIGHIKHNIDKVRRQLERAELAGNREEINSLLNTYQTLKAEMNQLKRNTPGKGGA